MLSFGFHPSTNAAYSGNNPKNILGVLEGRILAEDFLHLCFCSNENIVYHVFHNRFHESSIHLLVCLTHRKQVFWNGTVWKLFASSTGPSSTNRSSSCVAFGSTCMVALHPCWKTSFARAGSSSLIFMPVQLANQSLPKSLHHQLRPKVLDLS